MISHSLSVDFIRPLIFDKQTPKFIKKCGDIYEEVFKDSVIYLVGELSSKLVPFTFALFIA